MNKVYKFKDGSELHVHPAPLEMAGRGPNYWIHSPRWQVHGNDGCDADLLAHELCASWKKWATKFKDDMAKRFAEAGK